MWTAMIFAGITFSGIIFLMWFLVQLLREQPFRPRRIHLTHPFGLRSRVPVTARKWVGHTQERGRHRGSAFGDMA
jgi:hypothetical protein